MNSGPVRPCLVAGVGAYSLKSEITGIPGASSTTDTRLGVSGGAGVLFRLGVISAYVEGRVDNVCTEKGPITSDQVQVVPVTFGIVF